MAERSVFVSEKLYPYFQDVRVQFEYFPGFALSQKRKSEISLNQNFLAAYPEQKVLEVSGASLHSLGAALSAMNLKKQTKSGLTTVESAFQSSRVYRGAQGAVGPFEDLLFAPGKAAKKAVRERSQGLAFSHYRFDGMDFYAPDHCISLFYNFLYLNALCEKENEAAAQRLLEGGYTAFTDLATQSLNSQARACAIFVSLARGGLLDQVRDFDSYLRLMRTGADGAAIGRESYERVQLLDGKGNVRLRAPRVPCRFGKAEAESWYAANCTALTNRKSADNFLDTAQKEGAK